MQGTIIDLLRHGEPVGGGAYRGHSIDDPLSDKGWQQMWAAVEGPRPWQVVVTSPMRRCREFAERLIAEMGVPLQQEPDLREIGFGRWEGLTPAQVQAQYPEEYAAFYRDPVQAQPQGAEPLAAFFQRVSTTYARIQAQYAGQRVLIVAHAGVNRAILSQVLQAPLATMYRLKIANAGLSRIEYGSQGGQLTRHNCRLAEL